jgi:hypothetical protein
MGDRSHSRVVRAHGREVHPLGPHQTARRQPNPRGSPGYQIRSHCLGGAVAAPSPLEGHPKLDCERPGIVRSRFRSASASADCTCAIGDSSPNDAKEAPSGYEVAHAALRPGSTPDPLPRTFAILSRVCFASSSAGPDRRPVSRCGAERCDRRRTHSQACRSIT